ncbi:unnamed protein product [Brachionus calyciflorus]|uniref:Uncharacterized protein n=1 Tax=Brachionus calyciflorus TaxID=104777 RepID=A0A814E0Q6_9BILA|nr:unnamed protein product [Brachionus calyciflorus]
MQRIFESDIKLFRKNLEDNMRMGCKDMNLQNSQIFRTNIYGFVDSSPFLGSTYSRADFVKSTAYECVYYAMEEITTHAPKDENKKPVATPRKSCAPSLIINSDQYLLAKEFKHFSIKQGIDLNPDELALIRELFRIRFENNWTNSEVARHLEQRSRSITYQKLLNRYNIHEAPRTSREEPIERNYAEQNMSLENIFSIDEPRDSQSEHANIADVTVEIEQNMSILDVEGSNSNIETEQLKII